MVIFVALAISSEKNIHQSAKHVQPVSRFVGTWMVGGQWLVVGEREMAVVLGGARQWHRQRQARVGVDRDGSEGEDGEGGV